jgi:hypothetical protein
VGLGLVGLEEEEEEQEVADRIRSVYLTRHEILRGKYRYDNNESSDNDNLQRDLHHLPLDPQHINS